MAVFGLVCAVVIIAGAALWQFFLRSSQPQAEKVDLRKVAFPLPGRESFKVCRTL